LRTKRRRRIVGERGHARRTERPERENQLQDGAQKEQTSLRRAPHAPEEDQEEEEKMEIKKRTNTPQSCSLLSPLLLDTPRRLPPKQSPRPRRARATERVCVSRSLRFVVVVCVCVCTRAAQVRNDKKESAACNELFSLTSSREQNPKP